MNFWKKLFAGMGFVCGFLVFETMSLAYHNSSRCHKNRKGRCRRNSFWDTLTRYMIFAWIYDGVKKSREQVCAIHADVTLPPDREQGSEATEQQLHVLLYQTDVPEAELNAALSDLRAQRRREKAQYQGAPFADVFQVELILSEEDSDRACIVDVGDTGMSYVIPWSSIPQELQQPLRRYVAQADGKLCGYCKEDLCNTENGRMIVELYLGKQEHHVSRILY